MDLSEAYADLVNKMKLPNITDIDTRIKGALPSMEAKEDKASGVNKNVNWGNNE